jgi:hypothetical protein
VLASHDYESGHAVELMKMITDPGGGFGRGALTAFGEPEVKAFVQGTIDESLKLERPVS